MNKIRPIYKTNAVCPKCKKRLNTSDLREYSFLCKNCDENFYDIEVRDIAHEWFGINIPISVEKYLDILPKLKALPDELQICFIGCDDSCEDDITCDIGFERTLNSEDMNQIIDFFEENL